MCSVSSNWVSVCPPDNGDDDHGLQELQYYTKDELYRMAWADVDFENHKVVCCPCGGPVAIARDPTKMVRRVGKRADIRIYNAAGIALGCVQEVPSTIIDLGWTAECRLLVVTRDGVLHTYDQFGAEHLERPLSLDAHHGADTEAVMAAITGDAAAVLLSRGSSLRVHLVPSLSGPPAAWRVVPLTHESLEAPPACWALLPARLSASEQTEVLIQPPPPPQPQPQQGLAPGKGAQPQRDAPLTLLRCAEGSCVSEAVAGASVSQPLAHISPSADGAHIALVSAAGAVRIVSQDLRSVFCEVSTGAPSPPLCVAWCASQAVGCLWDERLLLVEPSGAYVGCEILDGALCAVSGDPDGLRVVGESTAELLRKVPRFLSHAHEPGSGEPAAVLIAARASLDAQEPRGDGLLRSLKEADALETAVEECVASALFLTRPEEQLTAMRAAVYGRAFTPDFPPHRLHQAAQTLRLLNALREPTAGLPLTQELYEALGSEAVVARLVASRQHALALAVCEQLGLGAGGVLLHWATAKVLAAPGEVSDAQLGALLQAKLGKCRGVSYSRIAQVAASAGRVQLAAALLEHEPSSSAQVPLLLSLGSHDAAVRKAAASGDPDLLLATLLQLAEKGPDTLPPVLAAPHNRAARRLWDRHRAAQGIVPGVGDSQMRGALEDDWGRAGACVQLGGASLSRALPLALDRAATEHKSRGGLSYGQHMEAARRWYSTDKELSVQAGAAADAVRLHKWQLAREASEKQEVFAGLSLHGAYLQCMRADRAGGKRAASELGASLKIAAGEQEWLQLRHQLHMGEWETILRGVQTRRLVEVLARAAGTRPNEVWERLHCMLEERLGDESAPVRSRVMGALLAAMPDTVPFKERARQQAGGAGPAPESAAPSGSSGVRSRIQQMASGQSEGIQKANQAVVSGVQQIGQALGRASAASGRK